MCCSGLRGGASEDVWPRAANASIFSCADENVFSLLARAGPQREKLRSFLPGFERVFARGCGSGMGGVSGRSGGLAESPCVLEDDPPVRRQALAPRVTRDSAA
ncbi:hypothetical protein D1006_06505 [Burkholderia stabilis]|uniref:Uncharacterized protein n=1 Tax=Burkholderia stabilis TaxID=95485 RepID=A0A4Q2ANT6_9BURK|nr:hypothetical protein D1006_06505 [Burkholderia stabilis]